MTVSEWLFGLDCQITGIITDSDKLCLAYALLREDALSWYTNLLRTVPIETLTFTIFCGQIKQQFQFSTDDVSTRFELQKLSKQSLQYNLNKYSTFFYSHASKLSYIPNKELVTQFLSGLKPRIAFDLAKDVDLDQVPLKRLIQKVKHYHKLRRTLYSIPQN